MKVYAHCDASGAVHSLVLVNAPEGLSAMATPRPGQFVVEVEGEVPGLNLQAKPKQVDLETLRKGLKSLRVATPVPRCQLVHKI